MLPGLLLLILLLGAALRIYRLDGQSLWSDEGASVVMAGRDVGAIIVHAAGDIHPPLYYIVLHWWSLGVGLSAFALRYLSVLTGVLVVALTFWLGRRLVGPRAAMIAAGAAAISPLLVYYSQELRMYIQMAALTAAATACFLHLLEDRPAWRWRIAYVVLTTAALATQYFAATVLVFHNLAFVGAWLTRRLRTPISLRTAARPLLTWLIGQVVIVLLYLPWLWMARHQLVGWPAVSQPFSAGELLQRVVLVFGFGLSWEAAATPMLATLVVVLVGAGLVWLVVDHRPAAALLLAGYLGVPIALMYVVSLSRPMYNPKFLLVALPPFCLLIGAGVAGVVALARAGLCRVVRRARLAPALATVVTLAAILLPLGVADGRALQAYYDDPRYARDDYRGLAETIARLARPGDGIILDAPGQIEIFNYYFHGDLPRYPLPRQRPIDTADAAAALAALAERHDRLWLVRWAAEEADPTGFIDQWLNRHAFKTSNRWFGGVQLILYTLPSGAAGALVPKVARFGDQIRLLGFQLGSGDGVPTIQAGDVLPLVLRWTADAAIAERYTVFTHLIDRDALIWGQRDSEPVGGTQPTTTWRAGDVIDDRYGLPVFVGTPPGRYEIEIGFYRATDGRRLPVVVDGAPVGDRLILGEVQVERPAAPPDPGALEIQHPLVRDFGAIRLLGFDLHRLGAGREAVDFRRNDLALLTLYWQARAQPRIDAEIRLMIVAADGRTVRAWQTRPAAGRAPTSSWQAGDLVRDQQRVVLDLPPGNYRLRLGVEHAGQLLGASVDLGQFAVE